MTANASLVLSSQIKDLLRTDLSHVFYDDIPIDLIEKRAIELMPDRRDRIFTPGNLILSMLLSATLEDKTLQNGLNIFKASFEENSQKAIRSEAEQLHQEKINDQFVKRTSGRPKKYQSRLPKSSKKPLSSNTSGYSTARKMLDKSLIELAYKHSADFGVLDKELWHGMKTFISDGTYLQLQDTNDIKSHYSVKGMEDSYSYFVRSTSILRRYYK